MTRTQPNSLSVGFPEGIVKFSYGVDNENIYTSADNENSHAINSGTHAHDESKTTVEALQATNDNRCATGQLASSQENDGGHNDAFADDSIQISKEGWNDSMLEEKLSLAMTELSALRGKRDKQRQHLEKLHQEHAALLYQRGLRLERFKLQHQLNEIQYSVQGKLMDHQVMAEDLENVKSQHDRLRKKLQLLQGDIEHILEKSATVNESQDSEAKQQAYRRQELLRELLTADLKSQLALSGTPNKSSDYDYHRTGNDRDEYGHDEIHESNVFPYKNRRLNSIDSVLSATDSQPTEDRANEKVLFPTQKAKIAPKTTISDSSALAHGEDKSNPTSPITPTVRTRGRGLSSAQYSQVQKKASSTVSQTEGRLEKTSGALASQKYEAPVADRNAFIGLLPKDDELVWARNLARSKSRPQRRRSRSDSKGGNRRSRRLVSGAQFPSPCNSECNSNQNTNDMSRKEIESNAELAGVSDGRESSVDERNNKSISLQDMMSADTANSSKDESEIGDNSIYSLYSDGASQITLITNNKNG